MCLIADYKLFFLLHSESDLENWVFYSDNQVNKHFKTLITVYFISFFLNHILLQINYNNRKNISK